MEVLRWWNSFEVLTSRTFDQKRRKLKRLWKKSKENIYVKLRTRKSYLSNFKTYSLLMDEAVQQLPANQIGYTHN